MVDPENLIFLPQDMFDISSVTYFIIVLCLITVSTILITLDYKKTNFLNLKENDDDSDYNSFNKAREKESIFFAIIFSTIISFMWPAMLITLNVLIPIGITIGIVGGFAYSIYRLIDALL